MINSDSIRPHHQIADAIDANDVYLVSELLSNYPEYRNEEMHDGWLHYSAYLGRMDVVKCLLHMGFDVNKRESLDGIMPLKSACLGGHIEVVRYLLDHGAQIDISASIRNPLFATIAESIKDTMNKSWGPPTGEAPAIAKLLLERGLDPKVRYNTKTMKNMDALAFAMMMGAFEVAQIIASWNANGDEEKAKALMVEADAIAEANTKPVPPGEHVAPS